MKKIAYLLIVLLMVSCNSDSGWDCMQTAGDIIQTEVGVPEFTKVLVAQRAKLIVQQGEEQKVVVETGENLLSDVEVSVVDGVLKIYNHNSCNLVRDYGLTKIFVTSPNLTEIRSSTGYLTESIGVLRYPKLSLLSEDFGMEDEYHTNGDFKINLEVENLTVSANGLSKFYLSGKATNASFGLYASDCRIYSEDLVVQNLNVYHRSTGPMVVNPQQSIKGKIVGLGDIISKNKPPVVEVEELYRGRLIFE